MQDKFGGKFIRGRPYSVTQELFSLDTNFPAPYIFQWFISVFMAIMKLA